MDKKCNYNDNCSKAKKIVEEANRNLKYFYVEGPTGPKGEKGDTGPATIRIGETITLESNEEAFVENVGTKEDTVLRFHIPRGVQGEIGPKGDKGDQGDIGPIGPQGVQGLQGPKGDKGEIGPQGPQGIQGEKGEKGDQGERGLQGPQGFPGEIGISEVITVDGTETIGPDEDAEVQDDKLGTVHHLTFYIPQGPKGDVGPEGPQGIPGQDGKNPITAYGMRYSTTSTSMTFTANTETTIPLADKGSFVNVDVDTNDSIVIKESGIYLISYFFSGKPMVRDIFQISVKSNDILLPATNTNNDWEGAATNTYSNTIISPLTKDDVIQLCVRTNSNTTVEFDGTTNAILSLIKIY